MSVQAEQVQQLILRSKKTLFASYVARLHRAISCCRIAKITSDDAKRLRYFLVAEATSAKFLSLRSQGKIDESKAIVELMSLLEEELGGTLYVRHSAKLDVQGLVFRSTAKLKSRKPRVEYDVRLRDASSIPSKQVNLKKHLPTPVS